MNWPAAPLCLLALVALFGAPALAEDRPLGEPLRLAAEKFGITAAEVDRIKAGGGEFACPGDRRSGARLNGWLISDREVLTNAHAIIEGEEDPGHPYLRQPVRECSFTSFRELGAKRPEAYRVNLNGLGAVLRQGARPPLDPTRTVGSDVLRLRLERPVAGGVPLVFDPAPVAKGDALLLISRVPTAYRTDTLPGDDLLIEQCEVTELDRVSERFARGAVTDCNGAQGMSAGIVFARANGKLVAKGFLVSLEYVREKGTKEETLVGARMLLFDAKFEAWLKGGECAFWPAALEIKFCGARP